MGNMNDMNEIMVRVNENVKMIGDAFKSISNIANSMLILVMRVKELERKVEKLEKGC
jgi:hypothetical protein